MPKEESKRVMTFANHDDYISFRHHTYKKSGTSKEVELNEVIERKCTIEILKNYIRQINACKCASVHSRLGRGSR